MQSSEDCWRYAVGLVCRIFDVEEEDLINGSRKEEIVDARCALIHILVLQGVSKRQIEQWTGLCSSSQAYLLDGFRSRSGLPWYRHKIVAMIKDAKETCPIAFKAHDKDGNIVLHLSKHE